MPQILVVFICVKILKWCLETWVSALNRRYYSEPTRQKDVCQQLGISPEEFTKTLNYTEAKHRFNLISSAINLAVLLLFLLCGGFGLVEQWAMTLASTWSGNESPLVTGLCFFGIFGLLSFFYSLPFDYYGTFFIEEAFGFNRQDLKGFVTDKIKGLILSGILGGVLLSLILYVMGTGTDWWLWAWAVVSGFSMVLMWLYPSLLAPLFNSFKPLPEGELKAGIFAFASKINFRTSGIFVMDASKRSSHGNAYFTGIFGEKRIVLFDTLLETLNPQETIAVLAHELGHFKLNHVRMNLIRSTLITGGIFYLLNLCMPLEAFYHAFYFKGVTDYAALVVFFSWFGILDYFLTPISSLLSRSNEFAADAFAKKHLGDHKDLSSALVKLQKSNSGMPLSHPIFSTIYYSHPPITERIKALAG